MTSFPSRSWRPWLIWWTTTWRPRSATEAALSRTPTSCRPLPLPIPRLRFCLADWLVFAAAPQLLLCESGGMAILVEFLMIVFRPGGCAHPTVQHIAWIFCHLSNNLEGALFMKSTSATKLLVRSITSGPHNPGWPSSPAILPAVAAIGLMAKHNEQIRENLQGNLAVNSTVAILKVCWWLFARIPSHPGQRTGRGRLGGGKKGARPPPSFSPPNRQRHPLERRKSLRRHPGGDR